MASAAGSASAARVGLGVGRGLGGDGSGAGSASGPRPRAQGPRRISLRRSGARPPARQPRPRARRRLLGGRLVRGQVAERVEAADRRAREDVLRQPEVRHVADLAGGRLRRGGAGLGGRPDVRQLLLHPLDAQREAAALGVDLEDLHAHVLARLDDLARVLHVVVGQLGDVHEPLDAVHDLDERAEGDDLGDLALQLVADPVGVDHPLPRVLLGLLEAQGDALAVAVDVEHLDRHHVADREDLGRVVHVAPGQLGDVDQAVDAVEVHERAEVDDVRDRALHDHARLEAVEDLLADLLALLLEDRAAAQHHVVARAVQLDDLALDLGAEELVQVLDAADVDQRGGQEAAHAQVDDQAALDDLDHGALDGLAGLGGGLDLAPGLLEARALLGEDEPAVLVLLGEDEGVDLLAELHLVVRIDRLADRELIHRNDALALVADVDQDLVLVDAHDLARHDVALLEGDEGGVVVGDDLTVDFEQHPARALDGARWCSSLCIRH